MITDPLARPLSAGSESDLQIRSIGDNISPYLTSKLIGGVMCLTAVFCLSAESPYPLHFISQLPLLPYHTDVFDTLVTIMRIIKDQATMPQILAIISLGPSSTAALYAAPCPPGGAS